MIDRLEKFLQSSAALILCLTMVLLFSIPNNIEVISRLNRIPYLSPTEARILAFFLAVVIEFIILVLAAIGQTKAASLYAWSSFFMHLIYYHRWKELLDLPALTPDETQQVLTDFFASFLISAMIASSIHYFSRQIKIKIDAKQAEKDKEQETSGLEQKLTALRQEMSELSQEITEAQQAKTELGQEMTDLGQKITEGNRELSEAQQRVSVLSAKAEDYEARIETAKKSKNRLKVGIEDPEILKSLNEIE